MTRVMCARITCAHVSTKRDRPLCCQSDGRVCRWSHIVGGAYAGSEKSDDTTTVRRKHERVHESNNKKKKTHSDLSSTVTCVKRNCIMCPRRKNKVETGQARGRKRQTGRLQTRIYAARDGAKRFFVYNARPFLVVCIGRFEIVFVFFRDTRLVRSPNRRLGLARSPKRRKHDEHGNHCCYM